MLTAVWAVVAVRQSVRQEQKYHNQLPINMSGDNLQGIWRAIV